MASHHSHTPDLILSRDEMRRFFSKIHVDADSGCWLWRGCRTKGGHGHFHFRGSMVSCHRLIYAWLDGSIPTQHTDPSGLQVHHECRQPSCCNPNHLVLVSPREHVHEHDSPPSVNGRKGLCLNGHEFEQSPDGTRYCPVCARERARQHYIANREHALEYQKNYRATHKDKLRDYNAKYKRRKRVLGS